MCVAYLPLYSQYLQWNIWFANQKWPSFGRQINRLHKLMALIWMFQCCCCCFSCCYFWLRWMQFVLRFLSLSISSCIHSPFFRVARTLRFGFKKREENNSFRLFSLHQLMLLFSILRRAPKRWVRLRVRWTRTRVHHSRPKKSKTFAIFNCSSSCNNRKRQTTPFNAMEKETKRVLD